MESLSTVLEDLVRLAKRGSISEEELRRLVGYVMPASKESSLQESQREQGDGDNPIAVTNHPAAPMPEVTRSPTTGRQRQYSGRGENGWVEPRKARDLVLTVLLALEHPAHRVEYLRQIEARWGKRFISQDKEILAVAKQPRWQKCCEWEVHRLVKERLAEHPQRGVLRLTPSGKIQAELAKTRVMGY